MKLDDESQDWRTRAGANREKGITMNRKTIAIYAGVAVVSLGIGAALAGSSTATTAAGTTETVTVSTPAETTTEMVTKTKTPASCKRALQSETNALQALLAATKIYTAQILPSYKAGAYGLPVDGILAKVHTATEHVKDATAMVDGAQSDVADCAAS